MIRIEKPERSEVLSSHKNPMTFKYVVLALFSGKLKEIYISNALTTNYSGTGGSFHRFFEKFLESNKLDVYSLTLGGKDFEDSKDSVISYLIRRGYM